METFGVDIDSITAAVGPVARVAYAAPHIYPMAAPAFVNTPRAERPQPGGDVLRLYAHVPFCNYACNFCFYAKMVGSSRQQMERYVDALRRELTSVKPGMGLAQLFVGGGTPTALPPDLLDRMLEAVFQHTRPVGDGVHTVESSPESISSEHIGVLQGRGIERVSMGIQSLDDDVLNGVHRRHSADEALRACRMLLDSGMNLNIDLIYGLPGQTEASLGRDLELVAGAGVHSVTLYNLRTNEQTPVAKFVSNAERIDLARLMKWREFVRRAATKLGFTQTRWHTFKRLDGIAARHQWLPCFDDTVNGYQLGIGMSARSHLGFAVYRNHTDLRVYMDRLERGDSPVEETFVLGESDRKTQFVARTIGDGKPLDRDTYQRAFGCDIESDHGKLLERLRGLGLIEDDGSRLRLTDAGQLIHDVLTVAFYPAPAKAWMEKRQRIKLDRRARSTP